MERADITMSQQGDILEEWAAQEIDGIESQKNELAREKKELEQEKRDFQWKQKLEKSKWERERRLFDMKWKVLESEIRKMAEERRELEQKKAYYYRKLREQEEEQVEFGEEWEPKRQAAKETVNCSSIFFKGVANELALKKRYKDLLKIFHPDNLNGDTVTLQTINREYDRLKNMFD